MNPMRMARYLLLFAVLLAGSLYFLTSMGKTSAAVIPGKAVVVELFTSEGCSSCPPADELLGHLGRDLAGKNVQVIPLGFHVDYWNSLGWKDRFSSADFSHRQELYARSLGVDGPYTPQMVVDGETEFVGNSASHAERVITQAASRPGTADVTLSAADSEQLRVQIKSSSSSNGNVMLAITEDNLTTQVGAGENNGHTLHHAAVVREFRRLGQLHDGSFSLNLPLKLQADWKRADLRAVVFVQ